MQIEKQTEVVFIDIDHGGAIIDFEVVMATADAKPCTKTKIKVIIET